MRDRLNHPPSNVFLKEQLWFADEDAVRKQQVPRQSVEKGCQKSICPWVLWLSKVICVFNDAFEAIYPLHHSGVVDLGRIEGPEPSVEVPAKREGGSPPQQRLLAHAHRLLAHTGLNTQVTGSYWLINRLLAHNHMLLAHPGAYTDYWLTITCYWLIQAPTQITG